MAPADNTPDFDSMSPDEIMAWMETLAKRQGVKSEELTTSADVDIPVIDPDTVVIDEPGYVPYGEERPPKPATPPPAPVRQEPPIAAKPTDSSFPAQPQTPRPTESPFPPPTTAPRPFAGGPPPRPQAQSADEPQGPARPLTPMTPRPSAPPPSGLNPLRPPSVPPTRPMPTAPPTPQRSTSEFAPRPAAQTPPPAANPPAAASNPAPDLTPRPPLTPLTPPQPAAQTPSSTPPPARPTITPPQNPRTAFEPPKWLTSRPLTGPLTSSASTTPPTPPPAPPVESKPASEPEKTSEDTDAMKWLESLAADQNDSMFNLDLSSLMDPPVDDEEPATANDPVAWLKGLAGTQEEDDSTAIFARIEPPPVESKPAPEPPKEAAPVASGDVPTVSDPFDSGVDPIAWLENLARRQGVNSEELTTTVQMDIPVPENPVIDEPGYNPFSFDAPIERRQTRADAPFTLDDEDSWTDAKADDSETEDVSDIERAINEGTVSPEQMQAFLEHQTDLYLDDLSNDTDEDDEDAPPVPAELPDWLLEQVGAPPVTIPSESTDEQDEDESAVVSSVFDDMPEWLREDADQTDAASLMGIFDDLPEEEDSQSLKTDPEFAGYTIEIDRNDPWVEAFEAEQEEGLPDITELPDWYVQNLSDPERVAAVEKIENAPALADAALPIETELKLGQPTDVPSWLAPAEEEPALVADLPDWLLELDATGVSEEIPDWLNEDSDVIEVEPETFAPVAPPPPVVSAPPPVITPQPEPIRVTPVQPIPPRPEPMVAAAPGQRAAASADLQTARSHADNGDVDTSITHYEALIRVNRELDAVVDDLTRLSKIHRANPAVHRVLGDGLMRQGKLQAALDVYREALNQL